MMASVATILASKSRAIRRRFRRRSATISEPPLRNQSSERVADIAGALDGDGPTGKVVGPEDMRERAFIAENNPERRMARGRRCIARRSFGRAGSGWFEP